MIRFLSKASCLALLFISDFGVASVCDRSDFMRQVLERMYDRSCDQITNEDLGKIEGLNLQGYGIKELSTGDFEGFNSLKSLYLAHNKIEKLPAEIFVPLVSLRTLALDHNPLKELKQNWFGEHPNLQVLHLSMDQPDLKVDRFWFSNLKSHLSILHLFDVKFIPDNFLYCLQNVQFLNVEFSGETIENFNYKVFKYSRVQHLTIFGQKLKRIPDDFFSYIRYVPKLTAMLDQVNYIHPLAFKRNRNLIHLSVSFSALESFPLRLFQFNKNLRSLSLSISGRPRLSIATSLVAGLKKLQRLSVVGSAFQSIDEGVLDLLKNLEEFQLTHTNIKSLPVNLIYELPRLRRLIVYINKIEYIDPNMVDPEKISDAIEAVYVAHNSLTRENIEALKAMLPGKIIL